jgi:hypothetical protein
MHRTPGERFYCGSVPWSEKLFECNYSRARCWGIVVVTKVLRCARVPRNSKISFVSCNGPTDPPWGDGKFAVHLRRPN